MIRQNNTHRRDSHENMRSFNPYFSRGVSFGEKTVIINCKIEGWVTGDACKQCFYEHLFDNTLLYPTHRICSVKNCLEKDFVYLSMSFGEDCLKAIRKH